MLFSKRILSIIVIIFALQILLTGFVLAAEKPQVKISVPIPGMSYDEDTMIASIDIADYINVIYNYALSIVGIVAVVMIVVGGVIWLTAGGSPDRVKNAKEYIASALIGLFLVFGSWFILNTVNPNLTKLKVPEIRTITEVEKAKTICCKPVSGVNASGDRNDYVARVNECLSGETEIVCPSKAEQTCDLKISDSCPRGQKCIENAGGGGTGLCSGGDKGSSCLTDADCQKGFKCDEEANPKKGIGSCEGSTGRSAGSDCSNASECESKICESGLCSNGMDGAPCNNSQKCAPGFTCRQEGAGYNCRKQGEGCSSQNDCGTGQWCNLDTLLGYTINKCYSKLSPGDSCAEDYQCPAGYECSGFLNPTCEK
ncbi:MAG: hypothetical protein PHD51_01075 [Patescibacteria group bacterium]|nr:hypothetical protein [Patescibacteria group bacterium]MDD5490545.1 hypothetical protein [Patescibacteria group bacterium]